ncbi:related to integral membrane protein [Cephalotrichum gorgonifer]|uniref:Related to integral membrane protein n=1 Tax=Cephalotrichum gorgonifer TaxID=2041049 RepID=A0AAE8T0D8_9PEZI|nr:related to integral membrane protein [Cephalotrichum gorgonifer]
MAVETRGPTVTAVAVSFAVISFIAIVLRLWSRVLVVKTFGTDDGLICVAVLLSWAFIACTIVAVQHGLGSRMEDFLTRGTENMIAYSQIVWMSSIFYNACLGFIKFSVLALYMRLGDRSLRRLAIIMMGVIGCQAGGNVMACIFQCTPVKAAYDVTILAADKKCININAFYLANAAVNIFTDILTYTLPFPLVMRLQVPRKQKIGVGVMLGLGLFACISSIVRITYIPVMLSSDDATFVISNAMYWSVIEINIGILATSIPSYKALASRYMPGLLSSSNKKGGSGSNAGFKMMLRDQSGNDEPRGGGTGNRRANIQTNIKTGVDDNSSEEELFNIPGRIGVSTTIVHQTEDARFGRGP